MFITCQDIRWDYRKGSEGRKESRRGEKEVDREEEKDLGRRKG